MTQIAIGLVQMACTDNSKDNLRRAAEGIQSCASQGAKIVCLQELVATPYFCQNEKEEYFDLAEPLDGPTVSMALKLARQLQVVVLAPFFERRAAGLYHNSVAVIDADGALLGLYRKMHIPNDPGFFEKYYFTPGDTGFQVFQTSYAKIAVQICWDQWFPEGARLAALGGAELLFYPTAIGWPMAEAEQRQLYAEAWEISMRAHAIANSMYVAAVNRTGTEGELSFWGRSFVAGPMGQTLWRAPENDAATGVISCELKDIEQTRREWPFLRDRRIEAYGDLSKRWRS